MNHEQERIIVAFDACVERARANLAEVIAGQPGLLEKLLWPPVILSYRREFNDAFERLVSMFLARKGAAEVFADLDLEDAANHEPDGLR